MLLFDIGGVVVADSYVVIVACVVVMVGVFRDVVTGVGVSVVDVGVVCRVLVVVLSSLMLVYGGVVLILCMMLPPTLRMLHMWCWCCWLRLMVFMFAIVMLLLLSA